MRNAFQPETLSTNDTEPDTTDVTGRDRLVRNVVNNWAWHAVYLAAGLILPRLVDRRIGQEGLGVWDLGWSTIGYFTLVSAGMRASVSRYVSRYRTSGNTRMLNRTATTALVIYLFASGVVAALAVLVSEFLPAIFGSQLGHHVEQAQWVILLLGISLAVDFLSESFNGVIVGCHRWGVHNAITSGIYVLTAAGMIVSLVLGGDLVTMAKVTLAGKVVSGLARVGASYRVCPGLSISYRFLSVTHAWKMIRFGSKTLLDAVSNVVMGQTNSLLIIHYLGPGFLAVYTRPLALVRHTDRLVRKFSHVLAPIAAAHQAQSDGPALRDLLVKGTRYGLYIALPMVLTLAVLGDPLLRLWMGPRYAEGGLLAILVIGHLAVFTQHSTYQILMGMGRHGLPALSRFLAAICSVAISLTALGVLGWGLWGAALAMAIPLTVTNAVVIPFYACRLLGVPFWRYVMSSVTGPAVSSVPFLLCLLSGRYAWPNAPGYAVAFGLGVGGLALAAVYWPGVVPLRARLSEKRIQPADDSR